MDKIEDDFGQRCRGRTKLGKRCKKKVRWLVPFCIGRESWLAAIRTGWPRLVRGMKEPEYHNLGFCTDHGGLSADKKVRYIYGIGEVGPVKTDKDEEYEAAKLAGDAAVIAAGFGVSTNAERATDGDKK